MGSADSSDARASSAGILVTFASLIPSSIQVSVVSVMAKTQRQSVLREQQRKALEKQKLATEYKRFIDKDGKVSFVRKSQAEILLHRLGVDR